MEGWQTASMPPTGSWILEGQRIWTGKSAIRVAQFTIALGVPLGMLAVVSSLILWAWETRYQIRPERCPSI